MSQLRNFGSNRDLSESFADFLGSAARFVLWLGILASVASIGFLVYYCAVFGGGSSDASAAAATANIHSFGTVLLAGMSGVAVGSTFMWWGEETLGVLQVVLAAVLYFVPVYLPNILANGGDNEVYNRSAAAIQRGGLIFGIVAIGVICSDIFVRVRERATQGSKADQMKFGKGVKEEHVRQNVFLGKCWQLPFCREFVRDKCPIYHSRRTCWKELVGCMCEEQVIRDAMAGKVIPKDIVAAAAYIPQNNKLTFGQKRERCKTCVIYNEHQKHKYKALLWPTLGFFVLIYVLGRTTFLAMTAGAVHGISTTFSKATLHQTADPPGDLRIFQEILLACVFVVVLAYSVKLLEYLIFKLKV